MEDLSQYRGNSHASKASKQPERPRVEPAITTPPTQKKPSTWARFRNIFSEEDTTSVWMYVLEDVVIPKIKDLIFDSATESMSRKLYGAPSNYSRSYNRGRGDTPGYTSYSRPVRRVENKEPARPALSRRERATHDFSNLIFGRADEAQAVVNRIMDTIEKYGWATVADFYDAMGITPEFTDEGYGWRNIGEPRIRRVRDGYILEMPRPIEVRND